MKLSIIPDSSIKSNCSSCSNSNNNYSNTTSISSCQEIGTPVSFTSSGEWMLDYCEFSLSHPLLDYRKNSSTFLNDGIKNYCVNKGRGLSQNKKYFCWQNGSVSSIQNKGPFNKYFGSYTKRIKFNSSRTARGILVKHGFADHNQTDTRGNDNFILKKELGTYTYPQIRERAFNIFIHDLQREIDDYGEMVDCIYNTSGSVQFVTTHPTKLEISWTIDVTNPDQYIRNLFYCSRLYDHVSAIDTKKYAYFKIEKLKYAMKLVIYKKTNRSVRFEFRLGRRANREKLKARYLETDFNTFDLQVNILAVELFEMLKKLEEESMKGEKFDFHKLSSLLGNLTGRNEEVGAVLEKIVAEGNIKINKKNFNAIRLLKKRKALASVLNKKGFYTFTVDFWQIIDCLKETIQAKAVLVQDKDIVPGAGTTADDKIGAGIPTATDDADGTKTGPVVA